MAKAKITEIEDYLKERYLFRFNTIKDKPEFKPLTSKKDFQPIKDYDLNSFARDMELDNIEVTTARLKEILESNFNEPINPIKEYFKNLTPYNPNSEKSYIQEICDTISINLSQGEQNNFYPYFKKWLIGVVANVLNDAKCCNHVCLVLTGQQGVFKTTWLNNLCPKPLREQYLFSGKINAESKDTQIYLSECLFINIDDQLRQLNKRDYNDLKELITKDRVTIRKPFARYVSDKPHIASFMASVNGNDFLTDPTGSRRFLPFEVESIDIDRANNYNIDDIYREAYYYATETNFQYWFTQKEIQEQHQRNEKFNVISTEEEHITTYFAKKIPSNATFGYSKLKFLKNADIQKIIFTNTQYRCSSKLIGEALTKLGYERKQKRMDTGERVWGYYMHVKDYDAVQKEQQQKEMLEAS